jgi:hypothetical protein
MAKVLLARQSAEVNRAGSWGANGHHFAVHYGKTMRDLVRF